MDISSIKTEAQNEAVQDNDYSKQKAARMAILSNTGEQECHEKPYEMCTRTELYVHAKSAGIKGRCKMDKAELIDSLRNN